MVFKLQDYTQDLQDFSEKDLYEKGKSKFFLLRKNFSPYVKNQAENIINGKIEDNAILRKNREAISIDGIETKDLDDAIWAEKIKNGYIIQIHIADPTSKIEKFSPLDLEAIKRGATFYGENIYNMYPDNLANSYFSLDENGKKLALSIDVEIDKNGNILDFEIYESLLENKKRYDYENFIDDFINPDSKNHKKLQLFYKIAKILRNKRKQGGANLDFYDSDRSINIGEKKEEEKNNNLKIPKIIVEEWAILGNICSAIFMVKNELQRVFRVHQKIDERAWYDIKNPGHKALSLDFYTHFTSPIRRYPDNLVHRIIKDFLNNRNSIYENEEIRQIVNFVNLRIFLIKHISRVFTEKNETDWGEEKVQLMRDKYDEEELKVGHYKVYIRNTINKKNKLPKSLRNEILSLIENGNIGDFSWCIGLFLLSDEIEIKKLLKQKIIKNYEKAPKKVINILNDTKIMKGDKLGLFEIQEYEDDISGKIEITVNFRGEKIYSSDEYFENELQRNSMKGYLRRKTIENIFDFFV